ncbi:type II toxin-antitoxin system PemK/MazF family toxin [Cryomorpha ignava]|uniref:mRNA interferase n=1 Tax=Cryomorpha ignava TaxID=101383 RepID=A0A7K3WW40_9FLAO|nr:type II toxin-antitoxin system PemK/MazF family toxin [Cryomorpha ignava]NEN25736.1 type II toxin-antitoxin system PemK/MazF family toxin [Cryomorpha ignava]
MRQGEIWMANLNPIRGSEQYGMRPVVIISGNLLNTHAAVIIACPLTSKIKNYHGNVILKPKKTNGLKAKSEILTFHIRSISKERLIERMGKITDKEFDQVKECLGDILRY